METKFTVKGLPTLAYHQGIFHVHNDRFYAAVEDAAVKKYLYDFLDYAERWYRDALVPFAPTKAKVENVLDALKAEALVNRSMPVPGWIGDDHPKIDARDVLPCANGLLHLPSRKLYLPTPAFFSPWGLDYDYDRGTAVPGRVAGVP